jgi:aspartyl protease family protein
MVSQDGEIVNLDHVCQSGVYEIPIKRRRGGTPVVEVTFNGEQTFDMLFDTGATVILISEKVAQELGVEAEGTTTASTPSNQQAEFQVGRLESVAAGGFQKENVRVLIGDEVGTGLLGQSFFSRFEVTIKENVIVLR